MNKDVLTAREAAFVAAYIVDPTSIEKAARKAGYKGAVKAGTRLLAKPHVAAAIRAHQDAAFKVAEIDIARVLKEIGRIAFVDIRKLFHANGQLKDITDLDDDTAAALAGVDIETRVVPDGDEGHTYITKKFKLTGKLEALEKLMKRLNAYPPAKAPIGPDGNAVANVYITVPAKSKRGETASG